MYQRKMQPPGDWLGHWGLLWTRDKTCTLICRRHSTLNFKHRCPLLCELLIYPHKYRRWSTCIIASERSERADLVVSRAPIFLSISTGAVLTNQNAHFQGSTVRVISHCDTRTRRAHSTPLAINAGRLLVIITDKKGRDSATSIDIYKIERGSGQLA